MQLYFLGNGYLQLVAHWSSDIQERNPWSVGSCKTNHPPTVGLNAFNTGSTIVEPWVSNSDHEQEPFTGQCLSCGPLTDRLHQDPSTCFSRWAWETTSRHNVACGRVHRMTLASNGASTHFHIRGMRSLHSTSSLPMKCAGDQGSLRIIPAPLLAPINIILSSPWTLESICRSKCHSSCRKIAILGHDSKLSRKVLSLGTSIRNEAEIVSRGSCFSARYCSHSRATSDRSESNFRISISMS
jgi:hypothetical protein